MGQGFNYTDTAAVPLPHAVQAQSKWYRHLVERLARGGYVVVQYYSPPLNQFSEQGVENEVRESLPA